MDQGKNRKIAIVMPWHISERGGGAEVQANYLASELARRGFDVNYICQTIDSGKVGLIENFRDVKVLWLKRSGKFAWLDQRKYRIALEKIRPDLVIQRMSSNITYVLGNYCNVKKIPFAWIATDNECPFKDLHLRRFRKRVSIRNSNPIKYLIFYFNSLLMDYFRVKGMEKVTFAFTQNSFQERNLQKEFGMKSYRIISGHPFPQTQISAEERFNNKIILWCGNLGKHKRPELFIELASKMQNSGLKFVMVGGHSDEDYRSSLFESQPDNLIQTGRISFEESLTYFDHASVLVNTSISEGFSNTYVQAWLRGIPVIVFGADPDNTILENRLGYRISNTDEAIEIIQTIFTDIELYGKFSDIVQKFASENHSLEKMTDLFLNCLSKNQKPPPDLFDLV